MEIVLNAEDALAAAVVATTQIVRKVAANRNSDHGGFSRRKMRERFADGIHGTMAELAAARLLNVAWTPGGTRVSRGDISSKIEVRATEHENGCLLVYERDSDESLFVLMIGHYPKFRMAGAMLGKDCKQERWWRADKDPACWWVPQAEVPAWVS